jgi:HSP20 family protein
MSLTRWEPELLSLRRAMNRLFDETLGQTLPSLSERGFSVPVDVRETDESLEIRADLPGVTPEDVDITVTDNTLTVKGEYKAEEEREEGRMHVQERRYGSFQRSVSLPTTVNTDAAEAKFEDGVLKVTLPKTEEAKPKRISVH